MYYILQLIDYTIYWTVTSLFTTLTSVHSDFYDSNKLTPTTRTCSLWQLWHARSHSNSDMLTLTLTCSLPLQLWHAHFHHWSACSHNSDIFTFQPLICFVSLLWHAHSHLSDNLGSLGARWKWWIWLHWEQAGSSRSGFADRGETSFAGSSGSGFAGRKLVEVEWSLSPLWQSGFAESKLVVVDLASLVAVDLASLEAVDLTSLGASW